MYVLSPRLQGLLQSVYGERSRLRKHMADLDATERETLLRIYRKVRRHLSCIPLVYALHGPLYFHSLPIIYIYLEI